MSALTGIELVYRLFAEKRLTKAQALDLIERLESGAGTATRLHPLVHQNTSTLGEQRFTSWFSGSEFYFRDHVVQGRRVMPGVALLEMARAAFVLSCVEGEEQGVRLKNIVWVRPLAAPEEGGLQVHIALAPASGGESRFEIYTDGPDGSEEVVHCQGAASFGWLDEPPNLEVATLRDAAGANRIDARECYAAFGAAGVEYGAALRGIEEIFCDAERLVAKLHIPDGSANFALTGGFDGFGLHPALLDAAIQACLGLSRGKSRIDADAHTLLLPFALDECEILGACTQSMWASIRRSQGSTPADKVQRVDIDLCSEDGRVCVRLKGLSSRAAGSAKGPAPSVGTVICHPVWHASAPQAGTAPPAYRHHVVMWCDGVAPALAHLRARFAGVEYVSLEPLGRDTSERFEETSVKAFEAIKALIEAGSAGATLVQILVSTRGDLHLYCGLGGLLRTARREQPRILAQLIEVDPQDGQENLLSALRAGCLRPEDSHIRYQAGRCLVRSWKDSAPPGDLSLPQWKHRGIYLLTGGAGGLGLIFAKEIAAKTSGAVLVLAGRSAPGDKQRKSVKELEDMGATASYRQVDVSQADAVEAVIEEIVAQYGGLHGVIHSAGVLRDEFILRKTSQSFREVLAPKVRGTVNLDLATRDMALDRFVLFSSGAGVFGSVGQADYATANGFLDAYAAYRNELVASGERHGPTVSLCWPLWAHGGMQIDDAAKGMLAQRGMAPLQTQSGIDAFHRCLASGETQSVVLEGDFQRVRALLACDGRELRDTSPSAAVASPSSDVGADALARGTVNYLKQLLSATLKVPPERVESDAPFEQYGIDSIAVMRMTNKLEETFGSLSKTLFFEYGSLRELSNYFVSSYAGKLHEFLRVDRSPEREDAPRRPALGARSNTGETRPVRFGPPPGEAAPGPEASALDIAIIGLAGRFPESRDLAEFWKNLRAGKDCITEIPPSRWSWREYYREDRKEGGHDSKWGGFIADVDKFDPLFFNISPREAEFLDPQERLFLEHAWRALEDAGYRRADLQKGASDDLPAQVGVYAGVMFGEYQLFGVTAGQAAAPTALSSSYSSIANRVSYVLNLHGPSLTVDTMCSSSLTSIDLACQDLKLGRTDLALAGGVNVSIHPNKYTLLSGGRFLSAKGRCASFGEGGDGYVPGEGVGVVVLKRLADAERDGDHIYGVIKGAAINHGGRTNAYSVPSPNAQQMVIARALRQSGIEPQDVTYIEAHGTGTELGDPIEIAGLTRVFGGRERGSCWIGSAKSNIGHCESAAGIAGLMKVLLQMKHGEIVPSLHSRALNPHIDFEATPFVVNQALRGWDRPCTRDGRGRRIAGVSSFGAGGSNAHLVVAEYLEPEERDLRSVESGPHAVVLSAKNGVRLQEYAASLLSFVQGPIASPEGHDSRTARAALQSAIRGRLADILEVEAGEIDIEQPFDEFGVDLFHRRRLFDALQSEFATDPGWASLIQKPSIALIGEALIARMGEGNVPGPRDTHGERAPSLRDLAYTLQVGREAMDERLALLVGSMEELEEKLRGYLGMCQADSEQGHATSALGDVYRGQVRRHRETLAGLDTDEDMARTIEAWIDKRKYDKLLGLWVKGFEIDWGKLYAGELPRRVSLPTYPFARERYWVPDGSAVPSNTEAPPLVKATAGRADTGTLLRIPAWRAAGVPETARTFARRLVVACGLDAYSLTAVEGGADSAGSVRLTPDNGDLAERYQGAAIQLLDIVRGLLEDKARGDVLLQLVVPTGEDGPLFAGLSGVLRTAHIENPKFWGQVVEIDANATDAGLARFLEETSRRHLDAHVRYIGGQRQVSGWQEAPECSDDDRPPWRDRGVYLITGGAGGLGLIFAQEIAEKSAAATLVLTGRSPLTAAKQDRLKHLRSLGARVEYRRVDVSDREAVVHLIGGIEKEFGGLNGILHSAGVIRDSFILKKTRAEMEAVLAAKVAGTVNLDRASATQTLDFMVLFSSVVGSFGNVGQADYAAGNAFMDAYADYRTGLVETGRRFGRTLAIGWPLWEDGGMHVDAALLSRDGLDESARPMPTATGLRTFYAAFRSGFGRVMVMSGSRSVAGERLYQPGDATDIRSGVIERLKAFLSEIAKLSVSLIDAGEPLESYGIDSVMITRMNQRLESVFAGIPKTLFFEYRTLSGVAGYLESEHASECCAWLRMDSAGAQARKTPSALLRPQPEAAHRSLAGEPHSAQEPIAIIGLSGRYPQADTLDVFWENLKTGKDCITEIPADRWPLEGFYEPNPDEARAQGKSYSKWGGFLSGFADFDPLFFGISPREAMSIDPQERLFLETCWAALESAGYTRASLRDHHGRRVGVFAGITKTGFDLYGPELRARGQVSHLHTSFSSAANRVSYVLDLRGPSMPIDTMCSASLTALHEACEHLRRQECEMAIAGGVNLYLHPSSYCSLSALGALSTGGKCRSFGQAGDGFVPGEGVGAVVLKPLSRAIADRDTILALVRATSVNHDGTATRSRIPTRKANSFAMR
jgi:acyl transferase domain-containing protein/acyl carrier protein